jgi:hypothetical protein
MPVAHRRRDDRETRAIERARHGGQLSDDVATRSPRSTAAMAAQLTLRAPETVEDALLRSGAFFIGSGDDHA